MAKFVVLSLAAVLLVCIMSVQGDDVPKAGGLGETYKPDDNINKLVKSLSDQIDTKVCAKLAGANGGAPGSCKKSQNIEVLGYKKQTVAGTNYFVKALIDDLVFHLRIWEQTWSNKLELSDISGPETKESSIEYF